LPEEVDWWGSRGVVFCDRKPPLLPSLSSSSSKIRHRTNPLPTNDTTRAGKQSPAPLSQIFSLAFERVRFNWNINSLDEAANIIDLIGHKKHVIIDGGYPNR